MKRVLAALFASLVVAGCGQGVPGAAGDPPGGAESSAPGNTKGTTDSGPVLPAGWRWESYGGVQVGVPGDWEWGNGSQRLGQWCIEKDHTPIVGRPGPTTLVGCLRDDDGPDPSTLLENTGPVVAFLDLARPVEVESPDEPHRDEEGDRLTVTLRGVSIAIQAQPALREKIAATVHPVVVDSKGCPSTHPISGDPGMRPERPVAVEELTGVTALAACKYPVHQELRSGTGGLLSSLRLEGSAAADVVAAMAEAPLGGGPDRPETCLPEVSYGDEVIVVLVTSSRGASEVFVRYQGCDHNGVDDGFAVRSLTAQAVSPLVADANAVTHFSGGPGKRKILLP